MDSAGAGGACRNVEVGLRAQIKDVVENSPMDYLKTLAYVAGADLLAHSTDSVAVIALSLATTPKALSVRPSRE